MPSTRVRYSAFSLIAMLVLSCSTCFLCRAQSAQLQPSKAIVVFWQEGFPTLDSEPFVKADLLHALGGSAEFADLARLRSYAALSHAKLLVMPYGSAVPTAAWPNIHNFLAAGGNLLLLGGEPLRVPVNGDKEGAFVAEQRQDSYSHAIGLRHSYPVPRLMAKTHFKWRAGYSFFPRLEVDAASVFAQEGRLQGLGYLDDANGDHLAAPVIVEKFGDSRIVALPFHPSAGYWESADGLLLIRTATHYAAAGATDLSIEAQYSAIRPDETPELTLHLRQGRHSFPGVAHVELWDARRKINSADIALGGDTSPDAPVPFHQALPAGSYKVRATWGPANSGEAQEYAENGLEVEDLSAIEQGPVLGTRGDFLQLDGKPFLLVGTNYFTTEENGWDFSGPRNAAVWDRDFSDMHSHGVSFVRTGVWMSSAKFVEPITEEVNERFLRNLEAYLAAAHRHGIAVNFTFFAFVPRIGEARHSSHSADTETPPPNPYLDPEMVHAEQEYVLSVVRRFRHVPWLSYDLINEPSFSNPSVIFHGNVPNDDPAERDAWHSWLEQHYGTLASLAGAWRITPAELGSWATIALPRPTDLHYDRYGNSREVRALDYNLFAQQMFRQWAHGMVTAIRGVGSTQLINVGQDEGGVTDRVLNQFYAMSGVSFTTNHTYWQDDALLWDSVAAKRPGTPNITGETGYQPAWDPDGAWRYDELTGTAIEERKWALGFAAGSSGAMQWDWAREVDFGIQRSDGSAKVWESMMRNLGSFAADAAPYATSLTMPDVAVILPQSLQLSVFNQEALAAQQTAVRVLYNYNRVSAYAVGEYQTDMLGTPKLIILPSAYGLDEKAWKDIEDRVSAGATLLISGPFGADPHLHVTDRAKALGIPYALVPLQLRYELLQSPVGDLPLEYDGKLTTILDRAALPGGKNWAEMPLGSGRILFSTLPLELNSDLASVAKIYGYALKTAKVQAVYSTEITNPGILICPTIFPHATLYVLTSETETDNVIFHDRRSNLSFTVSLEAGRAALFLITDRGEIAAKYGSIVQK